MARVRILLMTSSMLMANALGTVTSASAATPPRVVFPKPTVAASLAPLYRDLVTAMSRLAALTAGTPAQAPVDSDDESDDEEEAEDTMIAANACVQPES